MRTFEGWDDPPPGFMEADLVAHSGPVARGSFVQTLMVTDIATGWTECAPLLVREQTLLTASSMRSGSCWRSRCWGSTRTKTACSWTRRSEIMPGDGRRVYAVRPYRKNDQAWVEQKNGAVVRRQLGIGDSKGGGGNGIGAAVWSLRLFVNYFQPSFKLAGKAREGARVRKRYHAPAICFQLLLADPRTSDAVRRMLEAVYATLDLVQLLNDIRQAQAHLVEIAERPVWSAMAAGLRPSSDSSPVCAWRGGRARFVRPRARKEKSAARRRPIRSRRSTAEVHGWFEAEPWRTGGELFERLQATYPASFRDGQLRTLQRRIKDWRRENSLAMLSVAT